MSLIEQIDATKLPRHIAIIMDGNGRWAQQRGKPRIFGHREGRKTVRTTIEAAVEAGIEFLTLYAFSTENWNRPKTEVQGLMILLVNAIDEELDELKANGVKLNVIGDTQLLPANVQNKLDMAIEATKECNRMTLTIALSYSGRWEILEAVNRIVQSTPANSTEPITEQEFTSFLSTHNLPDPELLIRTSGEYRLSNFLLWQLAYAELYFTPTLWPDFGKEDFFEAIIAYQNRERRFGKTSEQVS